MEQNLGQTLYQLYTVINNSNALIVDNNNLQTSCSTNNGQENQLLYISVQKDEEDEEEQTQTVLESDYNSLVENVPNVKFITLDDGQVYLTTETDDNLTAVQPHFLTNFCDNDSTNSINMLKEEQHDKADDKLDFQEIQLEDGTCAIINTKLLNTLINTETTVIEEPETSKKKKYPCLYLGCGKAFTTAHHLSVHIRCHTGNRPYICTTENCDKAFATGYSLKAHLRIHTGEKPYGCTTCMKRFKTSGDLQKHVRTHTGEKPFKCPVEGCDKSFTTSNIRKVHIRSHTGERPYVCKVADCGKAFASATNYKNHMRIHSGEKPYVCLVEGCGKRFTEYSSLYKHNAVHQPYRNFQCDFCSQYFKFESTLKLHKKTVHNVVITENGAELIFSEDDPSSLMFELSESVDLKPVVDPLLSAEEVDDNL